MCCPGPADNQHVPLDSARLLDALRNADGGFGMQAGRRPSPSRRRSRRSRWTTTSARGLAGLRAGRGRLVRVDVGPTATTARRDSRRSRSGRPRARTGARSPRADPRRARRALGGGSARRRCDRVGVGARNRVVDRTHRSRALGAPAARPGSGAIDDGVALLRDREAVGGGWNYGNRTVLDEDLPPYVQTTAIALIGLRGADPALESRGLDVLAGLWRDESSGGLSVATTLAAFRTPRRRPEAELANVLAPRLARPGSSATRSRSPWAAIATGDGLGSRRMSRTVDRRTFLRGAVAAAPSSRARSAWVSGAPPSAAAVGPERVRGPGAARVAVLSAASYDGPLDRGPRRPACDRRRRPRRARRAEAQPRRVRPRHDDQHRSPVRRRDGARDAASSAPPR